MEIWGFRSLLSYKTWPQPASTGLDFRLYRPDQAFRRVRVELGQVCGSGLYKICQFLQSCKIYEIIWWRSSIFEQITASKILFLQTTFMIIQKLNERNFDIIIQSAAISILFWSSWILDQILNNILWIWLLRAVLVWNFRIFIYLVSMQLQQFTSSNMWSMILFMKSTL